MATVPTPQNFSPGAVSGDVNAAKAATLQALAAGGSASAERIAAAQQYASQQGGANAAAFAGILGQAGSAQSNFYNSVGNNVSQYSSQVAQAIPLEQEITGQQLNGLQAVAQEREAQRQNQLQMQGLQLQEEQARLAATNASNDPNSIEGQQRAVNLDISKANLAKLQNPAPSAEQVNTYDNQALDQLLNGVDGGSSSQAAKALAAALSGKSADDMGTGVAALDALITPQTSVSNGKTVTSTQYTTPNGKQLDSQYMQDQLRRYYAIRQALLAGQQPPTYAPSSSYPSVLGGGLVGSSGR